MIDLSNNNVGQEDFKRLYLAGQRRVYLKCTQGVHFQDATYKARKNSALAAKFKVGAYLFAQPHTDTPEAELHNFASHVGPMIKGKILRPMLDLEDGAGDIQVRDWTNRFVGLFKKEFGFKPFIYGNYYYLTDCHFSTVPGPLGLAGYGRNDGKEYPFQVPKPWKTITAHQYASTEAMPGIKGRCDIWHVYNFRALEIP